jgi:hypothetical protein
MSVIGYRALFDEEGGIKQIDYGEVIKERLDIGIDTFAQLIEYPRKQPYLLTISVLLQIKMPNYLQRK